MTVALRPMSLGEILDRTFQLYRSRFLMFAVVGLLPTIGAMTFWLSSFLWKRLIAQTTLSITVKNRISHLPDLVSAETVESFLFLLVFPIFAYCVSKSFLAEQPGLVEACKASFGRLRSLLFLTALTWSVWFGIGQLLHQIPQIARVDLDARLGLFDRSNVVAGVAVSCLKWIGSFYLAGAVCLSMPAWLVEQLSAGNAIRRGWMLARRRIGALLVVWLLRSVLLWMLYTSFSTLIYFALKAATATTAQLSYNHAIFRLIAIDLPGRLSAILVRLVLAIAVALIYYDQRIRFEGYDIEWMMNAAGMNSPPTEPKQATIEATPMEGSQA